MTKLGDIKWDKEKLPKKKHLSHEDKQVMAEYYQAGVKTGKSSEDLLAELEERYSKSTRQIQRYISQVTKAQEFTDTRTEAEPGAAPLPLHVAQGTGHEEQLRAMISHLIKSFSNLSSPGMPSSPQSVILPWETGVTGPAKARIENDPAFQSLWEHLENTKIPQLWKDLDIARMEYFSVVAPTYAIHSEDPEFIRREKERIEDLRNRRDEVWQRYGELSFSMIRELQKLLLFDRLPGRCRFCSSAESNEKG